tara:strand:- start:247 stop:729 length:483 start_codon:yes stop_codon:yes gene_type:complete
MNRVLLGCVNVDSGQLMVTDPCYLYRFENNEYKPTRKYVCVTDKKKIIEWPRDFYNYEDDIIDGYNKNMNTLIKDKLFIQVKDEIIDSSYSYVGACNQSTKNENQGGELSHGLGLSFSTGFGDGTYPVYAHYEDVNGWGRRIKKIEIEFFKDKDLEEDNE